ASTTFSGRTWGPSCRPWTAPGERLFRRSRQSAQRAAPRASAAIVARSAPVHHVPGERTWSRMKRWASRRSLRTGTWAPSYSSARELLRVLRLPYTERARLGSHGALPAGLVDRHEHLDR